MDNGIYRISREKGIRLENGKGHAVSFARGYYGAAQERDVWLATKLSPVMELNAAQIEMLAKAGLDAVQDLHFVD